MTKMRKTASQYNFESMQEPSRISIEVEAVKRPFPKIFLIPLSLAALLILILLSRPTASDLEVLPVEEQNFLDLNLVHPPPSEALENTTDEWLINRNYGIVIDAGSSGSRIYVYSWQSGTTRTAIKLEKADRDGKKFELKETPGLSTFALDPAGAGPHLEPLLKFAYSAIPLNKQASTPLYLFATAGMRLVEESRRQRILDAACLYAKEKYFYFIGDCGSHFRVITGELEGCLII
jgi:GDA1/CD39 (nucleoside phosphatase) family